MTQINLDEKRSELISVEAELKAMQEKYYNSTVTLQDKVTNDLRVSHLQKKGNITAVQSALYDTYDLWVC